MALAVGQMLILALPLAGTAYLLYIQGARLLRAGWNWSKPTRLRRVAGSLVTVGAIVLAAVLWAPQIPAKVVELSAIHAHVPDTLGQVVDIRHYTALWDAQGNLAASKGMSPVDGAFPDALRTATPSAIHIYVNGRPTHAPYRDIVLAAHALITVEIGRPLKPVTARYTFVRGQ